MQLTANILKNHPFESIKILKMLSTAHRYLGEVKGWCQSVPNINILNNTLFLQEAQDSSEIENIITTSDENFKYNLQPEAKNPATKEVNNYVQTLYYFAQQLQKNKLITLNTIIEAQKITKGNDTGIRKSVVVLRNQTTQEITYTPPPPQDLPPLLNDLEQFINNDNSTLDPLIKMAIIHHQFESIHPFYDGNGRIGRIINIMYLQQQNLLDSPVLYLSRYINHNKSHYYRLLQAVRYNNEWDEWVIFMLKAVANSAQNAIKLIKNIVQLQLRYKQQIRRQYPKIYSQDLLNNIFGHPYTKIAFLQKDLAISRPSAARYLEQLATAGFLEKHKLGRENYYLNKPLVSLLEGIGSLRDESLGF